jgi:hypothetical protein
VTVTSALTMLACLVLGLFTGGMLVIGVAFVSFWKKLSPVTFTPGLPPIHTSSAG